MTNVQEIMMPLLFNQHKIMEAFVLFLSQDPLSIRFLFSMIESANLNMFCML